MLVRDIMTPNPITIGPASDELAAVALMRARRCRHLPVVEDDRLVGIVTTVDLAASRTPGRPREQALRANGVVRRVADVMTSEVVSVPPEYPLEEAASLMLTHRISCLPVVAAARVVGIVTETDLFRTLVDVLGGGSRTVRVGVEVDNVPGEFAAIAGRVAALGGNILSIASHPAATPDRVNLTLRVEGATLEALSDTLHAHPRLTIRHTWDQSALPPPDQA